MYYGTGAVIGVPGHDRRDFDFCRAMGIKILPVVDPDDAWLEKHLTGIDAADRRLRYHADPTVADDVFTGHGIAINSSGPMLSISGQASVAATAAVISWLERTGHGRGKRSYKLRDWLFSRQRFWGEPFPIVYEVETSRPYPLAIDQLPVELPQIEDFAPRTVESHEVEPQPPLARATHWITVRGVIGEDGAVRLIGESGAGSGVRVFRRETNTMPNWAGSCWYYLRYMDPKNDQAMAAPEAERYWSGVTHNSDTAGAVDLYIGGAEHAVLHLLYARFWHKALNDLGYVSTPEPFAKLFNQGMITADAYRDARGVYVDIHDVEERNINGQIRPVNVKTGEILIVEPGKMGKRYKNGIAPEEICDSYSADVLRLYEMYMGPLDASKPWRSTDIVGMMRFVERVWRLVGRTLECGETPHPTEFQTRQRHKTVKRVTDDIKLLRMNTAIASMIEWTNEMVAARRAPREDVRTLVLLISPFAPHLGEELFSLLCPEEHKSLGSVFRADWPTYDEQKTKDDEIEVVVQVNGRRRGAILASVEEASLALQARAAQVDTVARHLDGRTIKKIILAPAQQPRVINFVVG